MPDPITAAVSAVKGGSAILQKKNTKKAAKKTAAELAAGQEKSLALQKEMYEKQLALQNPFLQSGNLSNAELMRQMGLSGDAASQGYGNMLRDFGASDFQADPGYAFRLQEGLKGMDYPRRGPSIADRGLWIIVHSCHIVYQLQDKLIRQV